MDMDSSKDYILYLFTQLNCALFFIERLVTRAMGAGDGGGGEFLLVGYISQDKMFYYQGYQYIEC